jgi:hypothetical protein
MTEFWRRAFGRAWEEELWELVVEGLGHDVSESKRDAEKEFLAFPFKRYLTYNPVPARGGREAARTGLAA